MWMVAAYQQDSQHKLFGLIWGLTAVALSHDDNTINIIICIIIITCMYLGLPGKLLLNLHICACVGNTV